MDTKVLNYRIVVMPDTQTGGTGKANYTAYCPTLGVADDGDSVELALANVKGAIQEYVDSLIEDNLPVPIDSPDRDLVTTAQIKVKSTFRTL